MDQDTNVNQAMGGTEINETSPKSGKTGPTIGIIIIIILILVAGLYYLKSVRNQAEPNTSTRQQELINKAAELEARLDAMNLDDVDSESSSINAELSQ